MITRGGGIKRLAPLLLASLLLHLVVLVVVTCFYPQDPADHRPQLPIRVDYVDAGADLERPPQGPPPQPAAPRRFTAPAPRSMMAPTTQPVMPAGGMSPPKTTGGAAPSPVPGQRPATPPDLSPGGASNPDITILAPARTGSTETSVGPFGGGPRRGTGPGSSAAGGFGTGTGSHGGGNPGAAPSAGQKRAAYQALLKRLVEAHKEYPLAARRSRQEGSCLRRFVLNRSGTLMKVEALSSCGFSFLDDAATRAIRAVGVFPPLPDEIAGAEASFTVTISFTLAPE